MAEHSTARGEYQFLEGKRLSIGLTADEERRLELLRLALEQHAASVQPPASWTGGLTSDGDAPGDQTWPTLQTVGWQEECRAALMNEAGEQDAAPNGSWPTLALVDGTVERVQTGDVMEIGAEDIAELIQDDVQEAEALGAEPLEALGTLLPAGEPSDDRGQPLFEEVSPSCLVPDEPSSEASGPPDAPQCSPGDFRDEESSSEAPVLSLSTCEIEPTGADEPHSEGAEAEAAAKPPELRETGLSAAFVLEGGGHADDDGHSPAAELEDSPMERTSVLGQPWESSRSPTLEFTVPSVWGVAPVSPPPALGEASLDATGEAPAEGLPPGHPAKHLADMAEFLRTGAFPRSPESWIPGTPSPEAEPDAFDGALVPGSLAELTDFATEVSPAPVHVSTESDQDLCARRDTLELEAVQEESADVTCADVELEEAATSGGSDWDEPAPSLGENGAQATDLLSQEALVRRLAESLADLESTGRARPPPPVASADYGPPPWDTGSPAVPSGPQIECISDAESGEHFAFDLDEEDLAGQAVASASSPGKHLPPPTSEDDSGSIDISEVSGHPMPELDIELGAQEDRFPSSAAPPSVPLGAGAPEPSLDVVVLEDEVHDGPTSRAPFPLPASRPVPVPRAATPAARPLALVAPLVPTVAGPARPRMEPDGRTPPQAQQQPGRVTPTFVAGDQRVVIHMAEGQAKRGIVRDLDLLDPLIRFYPPGGGGPEVLEAERIKAIFFLVPPGTQPQAASGQRIRVTFRDGRQVTGYSDDHRSARAGFFLVPSEHRANTARIYVYRSSVQTIGSLTTA